MAGELKRELADPDERTILAHRDEMQSLHDLGTGSEVIRHHQKEVRRELAVGIDHHERVKGGDLRGHFASEPVERGALPGFWGSFLSWTHAPCPRATAAVASVQLSATTCTEKRSGG